jgi:hypothetical protein
VYAGSHGIVNLLEPGKWPIGPKAVKSVSGQIHAAQFQFDTL